jgi:2-polyprenyl-6-methoxyphenol hydroxylase-like FAD-dependent oxidoreductase
VPAATRRAEVAGGGIAGLTIATALARRGWDVHVSERSGELREDGAALFLFENGLRVLEDLGAFDEAVADGTPLRFWESVDERYRRIQGDAPTPDARVTCLRRNNLLASLANAARRSGVEISTGATVLGATPNGEVLVAGEPRRSADIVIGADGVNSPVRTSLGLAQIVRQLTSRSRRFLIPRRPEDPDDANIEYWAGSRRLGITPCGPDKTYVYLFCRHDDEAGSAIPLDYASYIRSFPRAQSVIERIRPEEPWRQIGEVLCNTWHTGRVVLIGDAAHGMAPNLGQGAGAAMQSAIQLADTLQRHADHTAAFAEWECVRKPAVDRVQRLSHVYDRLMTTWPRPLLDLRSAFAWGIPRVPVFRRAITGTAQLEEFDRPGQPVGSS